MRYNGSKNVVNVGGLDSDAHLTNLVFNSPNDRCEYFNYLVH